MKLTRRCPFLLPSARWEQPPTQAANRCESRAYHTLTVGPEGVLYAFGGIHENEASASLQMLRLGPASGGAV